MAPGLTLLNVWELTYTDWCIYAHLCDSYREAMERLRR